MLLGVPKEIKDNEFRVGMTPAVVTELVHHGHSVLVETSAGLGSGLTDEEYRAAGATIAGNATDIFERANMVVKVKEPQEAERRMLRSGQTLFTYLHLAAGPELTKVLLKKRVRGISYETVEGEQRLTFPQKIVLSGQRLLHFQNKIGGGPDFLGSRAERRPGFAVFGVRKSGAGASRFLD